MTRAAKCSVEALAAAFPALTADLASHLAGCAVCSDTWQAYRVLAEVAAALPAPPEPNAICTLRSRRALLARARLRGRPSSRARPRRAAGLAAAAAILLIGGSLLRSEGTGRERPADRSAPRPSIRLAERAEDPAGAAPAATPGERVAPPAAEPREAPVAAAEPGHEPGEPGEPGEPPGTPPRRSGPEPAGELASHPAPGSLVDGEPKADNLIPPRHPGGRRGSDLGAPGRRRDRPDRSSAAVSAGTTDGLGEIADPPSGSTDRPDDRPDDPPEDPATCKRTGVAAYEQCLIERGFGPPPNGASSQEARALADCWRSAFRPSFDACCAASPDESCYEVGSGVEGTTCADLLFWTYDECLAQMGIDERDDEIEEGELEISGICWGDVANGAFYECCAAWPDETCEE